ncbi:MAG: glycosyltransferase family 2 protein [Acidithiobacillus sp.]|nr:glycosyltransferase family 2 protein [Acidithiobacillus sp.]
MNVLEGYPLVTFLVPAWNASGDLVEFLNAFERLSYPRTELVLCVGGEDGSYELANAIVNSNVVVVEQMKGEGKQASLRKSFPYASGHIIYLTDVDCRPNDTTVGALLKALIVDGSKVVTGGSRPLDEQLTSPFVRAQFAVDYSTLPKSKQPVTGLLGRNAGLWREVIEATGRFAENVPSGTDYLLAKQGLQAGYTIHCIPGCLMPTRYPDSISSYIRKQGRWIRNVCLLGRRFGASADVRSAIKTLLLPIILGASLVAGILLDWQGLAVFGLLSVHSLFNRLEHLRRCGFPLNLTGVVQHFLGDQLAAMTALRDLILKNYSW